MGYNNPVPSWRRLDLVEWAIKKFPNSPPSRFKRMKKARLWAIFFNSSERNTRKRQEEVINGII